jgi:type IV pilus biogenesis protein CpaD/CtpE
MTFKNPSNRALALPRLLLAAFATVSLTLAGCASTPQQPTDPDLQTRHEKMVERAQTLKADYPIGSRAFESDGPVR